MRDLPYNRHDGTFLATCLSFLPFDDCSYAVNTTLAIHHGHHHNHSIIIKKQCDHTEVNNMAPVHYPRQLYTVPPPRPPKGGPGIPVVVTKYISFRLFLQLFAGTVSIFILAVMAWKLGKGIRCFTREKVLRAGQSPDTRYAKTWYGWVSRERHEANKGIFKKACEKYREWTAWRSSRIDYDWIWWDPGQKGMEAYYEKRRHLRWLPSCLRSYKPTPADAIWNPGPPPPIVVPQEDKEAKRSVEAFWSPYQHDINSTADTLPTLPEHGRSYQFHQKATRTRLSAMAWTSRRECASDHNLVYGKKSWSQSTHLLLEKGRLFWTLNHRGRGLRRKSILDRVSGCEQAIKRSASLPCFASTEIRCENPVRRLDTSWESEASAGYEAPTVFGARRNSRKYQVWSTWMQVQPSGLINHKRGGIRGRPGTPRSEFLTGFSSQLGISESLSALPEIQGFPSESSDPVSNDLVTSIDLASAGGRTRYFTAQSTIINDEPEGFEGRWSSTPSLCHRITSLAPAGNALVKRYGFYSLHNLQLLNSYLRQMPSKPTPQKPDGRKKPKKPEVIAVRSRRWNPIPPDKLSTWEVRWIDSLDRKLGWFLREIQPGRRPFHFAILANHWINTETWMVFDPICRVPLDAMRERGDPRFNVPYPAQTYGSKHKYPQVARKRVRTPKINSWRAAVNRGRKASGLKGVITGVEMYENSSADEPPDGKIDPASWILRKPPQGFAMSTKQENAYYAGVGGWHETLGDWQKVRRGYRLRRIVFDGRVNRNRLKEFAKGIARYHWAKSPKNSTG